MIALTSLRKKNARTLSLSWNDGTETEYDVRRLRLSCPCAACVNEWTGEKMLRPDQVPEDVHPRRLFAVGRYALGIEWSDGHSTGIFSYDYLRRLGDILSA